MKKIIRMTESDLVRLVKKVIKEQENEGGLNLGSKSSLELDNLLSDFNKKQGMSGKRFTRKIKPGTKGILGHKDHWFDEDDSPVDPEEFDYDEEIEFGPDDFEDFISHTERDFPKNKWSFNMKGWEENDRRPGKKYWDIYTKRGPIILRKKRF